MIWGVSLPIRDVYMLSEEQATLKREMLKEGANKNPKQGPETHIKHQTYSESTLIALEPRSVLSIR